MDHETSIKTHAAERYLLGELTPPEREAFEQHYFDCSECAESVRLGFQFGENVGAEFAASPPEKREEPVKARSWLDWFRPVFLVPATACLAAAMVYQNAVQIPGLRARLSRMEKPLLLSSVVLAPSSRAAVPVIEIPAAAAFTQLTLAVGPVRAAERYEWSLRSDSGKTLFSLPLARLDPDSNVTVLLPTNTVENGYYDAVIAGVTGQDVTGLEHYRFAVRRN
jgi:anti-sigma factor RsiW